MMGLHVKDHFYLGGRLRSPGEDIEIDRPEDRKSLLDRGLIGEGPGSKGGASEGSAGDLRTDGPTVAEFVAAGYSASNYPPEGYASRSTPEEIAAAVAEQNPPAPKAEPPADHKMKPAPENKGNAPSGKAART